MSERRYAQGTAVGVIRTQLEIERIATLHGANNFGRMSGDESVSVTFSINGRRVLFQLPVKHRSDFRTRLVRGYRKSLTETQQLEALEQDSRERWRALLLVIKAKLEAVKAGITTFEEEFLAHIVTSSGKTVGEEMIPHLEEITGGEGLRLLSAGEPK